MTSRKVVTRSGRKFRGYFPSKKLNRMVEWESLLERDAILHFEFSNGVVHYQEQPETIYYEREGVIRRYHPDFALTLANDELVHVEVKPSSHFKSTHLIKKFAAITERYVHHPARFIVLTDRFLRQEPRLTNLNFLADAARFPLEEEEAAGFLEPFVSTGQSTLNALVEKIGMTNVLRLIAGQHLSCDLNLDLRSPLNELRLTKETGHDAVLI